MQAPKRIPDYPNYSISEDGTLYNHKTRYVLHPNCKGKVTLYNPHDTRQASIDRLVAEAFICPSPGKHTHVLHIDNDRHNCHVTNLRWSVKGRALLLCKCCGMASIYLANGIYCPTCINSGEYKTCDYQLSFLQQPKIDS